MNTCKTCRHWIKYENYGSCEHHKLREPQTTMRREEVGRDELVYSYNEGGSFYTGPDFGCVHHAP